MRILPTTFQDGETKPLPYLISSSVIVYNCWASQGLTGTDHQGNLSRSGLNYPSGFLLLPETLSTKAKGMSGVCLFSSAHKFTSISLPTQTSFECVSGILECDQSCLNILNICLPPGPATTFQWVSGPILLHSLVIWHWWRISTFISIPHHQIVDNLLIFWSLLI